MLIADVVSTPIRVPLRAPLRTALGAARHSEYAIVQVVAEDGTVGLGEISMIWHGNGLGLSRDVQDLVRPAIVGMDVRRRAEVVASAQRVLSFGRHSLAAVAAIDMALLDLVGKHSGLSAIDLLGGARRDRVRLSWSLSIAPVDDVLAEARHRVEQGFTALKVKGDADLGRVVAAVTALRRAIGDAVDLRVDLNMACASPKPVLGAARRLGELGVLSIEQPLRPDDLDGSAFLVEHSPVPIMLDESVWTASDALRAIRARACDLVNVYVAEAGGPTAASQLITLCDLLATEVAIGSMPELAVGTSAAAAAAFTAAHLSHPSDVCGHLYHAADVVHHDLEVQDGHLLAPRQPGLGVELDPDALARYRCDGGSHD